MHCVIIHESPVALQVELAEGEHSQRYKGHSKHQSKQRVWGATALRNTAKHKDKNKSNQDSSHSGPRSSSFNLN